MTGNPERRRERLSSVRNAARLLKEFSHTDRELGVSELARRLGLGTSTVHRLLATLADERLLDRGGTAGRYRLGLAVYELGAAVSPHLDLHEAALPVMASLRHSTRETVHIAVLDGLEVVFVERLEGLETVRIFTRVGTRLPAHSTSTGKVLLAALPESELRSRIEQRELLRLTSQTLIDPEVLIAQLREVAARGWAGNDEESRRGLTSVGAPIRDATGTVIAALSIAWPTGRKDEGARRRHTALVIDAATVISRRLGHAARARA
ncbi:IclR family transcriptional regulator [Pseudonocardia sp. H11422]|uniref:IclR family transcriptional regulator n=1 Tax=Pseudonocardia sp. H11422 TaxID=2835866 RepID=UPI001BDCA39E|nr:IclR family transcriptional regulator [Pseudonocardia sp. H11422]